MSASAAAQWTAIATIALAIFAAVAAIFGYLAFRKQSEEVTTLKDQAADEKALIEQQAQLLQVQSGQLDVQRQQLDDQRDLNARQADLMELQAQELRESLEDRQREASDRRRAQAALVFLWTERVGLNIPAGLTAHVMNQSPQPVYRAELRWYRGTAADDGPVPLPTIAPGGVADDTHEFPAGTNMDVADAVVTFYDAAGVKWRRRLDGVLTDLGD